jgi:guanylate kinase
LIFVFSGPAGAGKNAIMNGVMQAEPRMKQLPTATTRPPRDYEQEGREHEFLSEAEFRQRILDKSLIEWQIIHDKGVYGMPRQTVQRAICSGQSLVMDADVLGAMQLKQEFKDYVVTIFIKAPDKATLEKRLRGRADEDVDEADLQVRLRRADFELRFADRYDAVITNEEGQLDASVQEALRVVRRACEAAPPIPNEIGWKTSQIQQTVMPLIVRDGRVLAEGESLPATPVGDDELPFETLERYIQSRMDVKLLPVREGAAWRKVSIDFEAPQLVLIDDEDTHVQRNMVYILRTEPELTPAMLPPNWSLKPLASIEVAEEIQALLQEEYRESLAGVKEKESL